MSFARASLSATSRHGPTSSLYQARLAPAPLASSLPLQRPPSTLFQRGGASLVRCNSASPGQAASTTAGEVAKGASLPKGSAASALSGAGAVAVVTDESVPEGHRGLHGFLYGEAGADVHDAPQDQYQVRPSEDEGAVLLSLPGFLESRRGHRLAGLYAVYDPAGALQYVGYSRNLVLSLKAHATAPATGPLCSGVRVKVFHDAAMVTRARLEQERQEWLRDLCRGGDSLAPGNTPSGLLLWEGGAGPSARAAARVMSEAERAEYEEKKLKMRKAMGENLHDDVEGEELNARQRRLALLQAVEGDNWSAVIEEQTLGTRAGVAAPAVPEGSPKVPQPMLATESSGEQTTPGSTVISPFAGNRTPSAGGQNDVAEGYEEHLQLTAENVDKALEAVRPYLISDGGNVEVVGVGGGTVDLRLQGACGSCPSATTTMKMGIERVLREKFGDALLEVREVGGALQGNDVPTVETVDAHLDMLRPAIHNFKGSVEVLEVNAAEGVCKVRFSGPAPVGMGVQAAIKDKFPSLRTVDLVAAQ